MEHEISQFNGTPIPRKEVGAYTIVLNVQHACSAANDSNYKKPKFDPVGFIESSNNQEISDALAKISATSTRTYIHCFIQSMKYLVGFERKALGLYLYQAHNKRLKIILSLIYLVESKYTDQEISKALSATVNNCSYEDATGAYNIMIASGLIWDDTTLSNEIFTEFCRKATFKPARPYLVA